MNVGDHHLVVEGRGPELVLTAAERGFILGDKSVRAKERQRGPAEMVDVFFLRSLDAPQEFFVEKALEAPVDSCVRAAGQYSGLFDPEQPVIVGEFEDLDVAIGYDDAFPALPCPFCNSLRFLHGLNDVPDALRRQLRRPRLDACTVTFFVTTFLRSPAKQHFQDFSPPCFSMA